MMIDTNFLRSALQIYHDNMLVVFDELDRLRSRVDAARKVLTKIAVAPSTSDTDMLKTIANDALAEWGMNQE